MLFRKKTAPAPPPADEPPETPAPAVAPQVLQTLERLQKTGVQLLIRMPPDEVFTSGVVGLGRDSFFIDTLSPPEGDRRVRAGATVEVETLLQGMRYTFAAQVLGKVQFVDELPAFRVAYPAEIRGEQRRKSPRLRTRGDASLSFLHPFACDAPVVDVSEGGVAFEYPAELGRLRRGAVIREVLLELADSPVLTVHGKVVGNLVAELGALSLPRRYRASLALEGLGAAQREVLRAYLAGLKGLDVST